MKTMIFAATFRALVPGNRKGVNAMTQNDEDQHRRQPAAARQVVRQQAGDHRFATGYRPCGRHNSTATIRPMLENAVTTGARKPV